MIKLLNIQKDLKAPKSQYNSFGKYNYRNCEDILEALKPLCVREKAALILQDRIVQIGDRYYIESTATLFDAETNSEIAHSTAYAREELEKKGMDGSQVTGTASSYARKYALNGLFDIDDTKDADTDEYVQKTANKANGQAKQENRNKSVTDAVQSEAKPKTLLDKALKTEITAGGKTKMLKDISLEWLQANIDKAKDENLRKAMDIVIQYKFKQELREETPFGTR